MFDVRETDIQLLGPTRIQYTKALFYEHEPSSAPYTMCTRDKERDGRKVISAYQVYMQSVDEYDAAMRLVGSMEHWRKLCSLKWFMDGIPGRADGLKQWRKDMKDRDASNAKKLLMEKASEGNVQAARYLHEVSTKGVQRKESSKTSSKENSEVLALLKNARKIGGG